MARRRVVITGIGAVTPLGVGAGALWEGLCAGKSAIGPITRFDASGFRCKLGAELTNYSAKDHVPKHYRKAVKVMARDVELAVGAAKEAAGDAGLVTRGTLTEDSPSPEATRFTYPSARMGCHIGAGLITAESDEIAAAFATARDDKGGVSLEVWGRTGMENLTPLWMLKYLPNMLACHVSIIHGCEGPSNTITCAEASGLLCIGESARVIERGDADLCFTGSAENKVAMMGIVRTEYAGRLAETGEWKDGSEVVKPFDSSSLGGVVGEAGAIIILEDEGMAKKRGAEVYAVLSGFGGGHSARRPYAGDGTADEGLQAAMENALEDAGLKAGDIDALVLTGSGVPTLDLGESGAALHVFGERAAEMPVVTVGGNIGNSMAGNGSVLAAVAALCVDHQRVPARLNTGRPVLAGAKGEAKDMALKHVMAATTSLGGQNAAVVVSRPG